MYVYGQNTHSKVSFFLNSLTALTRQDVHMLSNHEDSVRIQVVSHFIFLSE